MKRIQMNESMITHKLMKCDQILGMPFTGVTVDKDARIPHASFDSQSIKLFIHPRKGDVDSLLAVFFTPNKLPMSSRSYFASVKKNLTDKGKTVLGYDVLHTLIKNPERIPNSWMYNSYTKVSLGGRELLLNGEGLQAIYFPEAVFVDVVGKRKYILYLFWSVNEWVMREHDLSKPFDESGIIVTAYFD